MREKGKDMKLLLLLPLLLATLKQYFLQAALAVPRSASIALPGCQTRCGNISIPFPFGMGPGCYVNEGFAVTCNNSFSSPRPYLNSIGLELMGVSLEGYVKVQNPVMSSNCGNSPSDTRVNLSGSPFIYSAGHNRFIAMGCGNYATLLNQSQSKSIAECVSDCKKETTNNCYGLNCCQTEIPTYVNSFSVNMTGISADPNANECRSAFVVDQNWLKGELETVTDLLTRPPENVPAVLSWVTDDMWTSSWQLCSMGSIDLSPTFCSDNSYTWKLIGKHTISVSSSSDMFGSYPTYVNGICTEDVLGCTSKSFNRCSLKCLRGPDNNATTCYDEYDAYASLQRPEFDAWASLQRREYDACASLQRRESKRSRVKIILIGCGSSIGFLLLLGGASLLYKRLKHRKAIKLKEKHFKKNGGLLLQRQFSRNMEPMKTFASKELEKATDNFNSNRILGQGGQGRVYKGMLADGSIVAVKKSSVVDPGKVEQFINEVVILSQINHRNVVKLLGCCLETEVPLLVYEFIPNGTLFQHLQDENEEFPITWEMRKRIAMQVADALSFMHSEAPLPIYHRDIKSSNILLDEKYTAKVSDFGISRSVAIDQTHLTTNVQGTFGYLDPEYFRSHQFTEKSDVYSFGVVLVELLTGERPINNSRSEHEMGLVNYFLLRMKEKRLFDILDARVAKEGSEEAILAVAKLAKRCVSMIGRKRPTMREVAMELQWIRASEGVPDIEQQCFDKIDEGDITEPWPLASSSSTLANDPTLSP